MRGLETAGAAMVLRLDGSIKASGLVGTRAGSETVCTRWSRAASRWWASSLEDSLEVICARAPCSRQ
jgi:hypothetical protein